MAELIKGGISDNVYGKGDVCLKLNPFDNYRLFTLYEDWRSDDRKPIDLSNNQKLFLVFKSKNREIRIPECDMLSVGYPVDKVNGQVLFKINQKNAIDILAMDNRTFYITRLYEKTDLSGDRVISSDEEVMYTGLWKDETSNTVEEYTSQIKKLTSILNERNDQITNLQKSNAELIQQNVEFASELQALKEESNAKDTLISEMEAKLTTYESGEEYDGTLLGEGTHYSIFSEKTLNGKDYTGKEHTEQELQDIIDRELKERYGLK